MSPAEILAAICQLEQKVKADMEARTGRPEPGIPDITEWTSAQMSELFALKSQLPGYGEEREAARARIQQRIAERKMKNGNV